MTPIARRLRQILVLLHMTTALGWLGVSAAMLVLTGYGFGLGNPVARHDVLAAATHLDDNLLADLSFMTVYTGLMLAGLTPWGYTRFWWVTVKLGLALGCALGGRAVFGHLLTRDPVPAAALVWTTIFMIAAIAFMAWAARTKPWGAIGRARPPAQPWAPPALWVAVILTPVADYITDLPLQAVPAAIVLGYHARRGIKRWRHGPRTAPARS